METPPGPGFVSDGERPVGATLSGRGYRSKTEHDLLSRLLRNARKKDDMTTARTPISRHACAVRIRIFRAAGYLILIKDSLGRILEQRFLANAEQPLQGLR